MSGKKEGKRSPEAGAQRKRNLDSKEQGSDHGTEIQGQGHYPENTIQTPHFDLQANLTEGQFPLQSLWSSHRGLLSSLWVCQALFPLQGLGIGCSFCLKCHFINSSYGYLPLILYLGLSSDISFSSVAATSQGHGHRTLYSSLPVLGIL